MKKAEEWEVRRSEGRMGAGKEGEKIGNGGGKKGKGAEEKEHNSLGYEDGGGEKRGSDGGSEKDDMGVNATVV